MNYQSVSEAFSKQSPLFDAIEERNEILQWMRKEIHCYCMHYFKPGNNILELNCGTGIDAVFFARQGMKVHATDISPGMLTELKKKIEQNNLSGKITYQQCSFTDISTTLRETGKTKFDHVFSDFGGLNCVQDIESVIAQFKEILNPGGTVTLVIMPPVCPWEMLLAFKGNFKTAFRRWKKNGIDSNVEGIHFTTYYFTPSRVMKAFGNDFLKIGLRGLACFTPPPYLEKFPKRYPKLFKLLNRIDNRLDQFFPFNRWADHFILTMQLK